MTLKSRWLTRVPLLASLLGGFLAAGCARETAPALAYNRSNAEEIRRLMQEGSKAGEAPSAVSTAEPDGWSS
jgi:hypothetical protein